MKEYYGTKKIQAEPGEKMENGQRFPGYTVVYPDGYRSWSPKDVFEASYRESGHLNFGHALEALKEGRKVARIGWSNGDHLFLFPGPCLSFVQSDVEIVWDGHHGDVLAEDWLVVE